MIRRELNNVDGRARAGEEGLSLVEFVIGAALILVMISPAITLSITNSRLRALDAEMAMAFNTCRNALEQVRAMPFSEVQALDGQGFTVSGPDGSPKGLNPRDGDADGMPGVFTVTIEQQSGAEILYRVRAWVFWQGVAGSQDMGLEALIADRSPV